MSSLWLNPSEEHSFTLSLKEEGKLVSIVKIPRKENGKAGILSANKNSCSRVSYYSSAFSFY
jgi:hypothetical protein